LSGLVFSGQGAFRPHASPLYVSVVDIRNGVIGLLCKVKVDLIASSLYISDLNSFDHGLENVTKGIDFVSNCHFSRFSFFQVKQPDWSFIDYE